MFVAGSPDKKGKYHVTKYPSKVYQDCPPRLEITVKNDNKKDFTYDQMASASCFPFHQKLEWKARAKKSRNYA